jgi:hypothetical protein
MEISFEPGLEEKARAALQAKSDREKAESMGVWEQYLDQRKAKRKQKSMYSGMLVLTSKGLF